MSGPTIFVCAATVDLKDWRDLLQQAFSRTSFHVFTPNNSLGVAPCGSRRKF